MTAKDEGIDIKALFYRSKKTYRQIVILKEKRKRTVSLSGLVDFMLS
jgi:hypothetical protein